MSPEFHAHPAAKHCSTKVGGLLRAQNMLHGSESILAPCMILVFMVALAIHHTLTHQQGHTKDAITKLMFLIFVQMLPLAFVDMKILSCKKPVDLFMEFSEKVLLMYVAILGTRVAAGETNYTYLACFATAVIIILAVYGFRPAPQRLLHHCDVWGLLLLSFAVALAAEMVESGFSDFWAEWRDAGWRTRIVRSFLVQQFSQYAELFAFVPAAWSIIRESRGWPACAAEAPGSWAGPHIRALAFFAWLVAFYSHEDMYNAWDECGMYPGAAVGHTIHFLLLLDFASFLLAQLYDPEKLEKLRGSVVAWLQDATAV